MDTEGRKKNRQRAHREEAEVKNFVVPTNCHLVVPIDAQTHTLICKWDNILSLIMIPPSTSSSSLIIAQKFAHKITKKKTITKRRDIVLPIY